ncbi:MULTISPECIES: response regulator transcription factor [Clostridium]|uniref:response regulator transcription factor n=1 Tax=Clostridium TaxID=1485 RepID=UPI0002CC62E8|nr:MULTISPECIES: response regulator transcription factor [Clostridium]EMU52482.1 regulatory protein VanR [Clostridium butyricum DKU-01]MCQ2015072.1 response regulator transcription factor [Clostridium butyricum]MCQ2027182.1 response regulator transcription factor [Clostridium butyricum]MDU6039489.1 response regulator transcription factor [Clostridium butyricum]QUF85452.1 response regulator transcription factor [Clostridium butyricum]
MSENILIVDDDKEIRDLISLYLEADRFYTDKAADGVEALIKLEEKKYSLVILDIMMPKKDGIETIIEIRKKYKMPVIFLTAKSQEIDMINGLTLGADDYISKPFSSLELIARVKAQLRRYTILNLNSDEKIIRVGDLVLNTEMHEVTVKGNEVRLTPTEYKILEVMCKNRNKVFTVEELYEFIWKEKYSVSDTSIMVHITKLRRKIENDSKKPEYIKTVWGIGYKI